MYQYRASLLTFSSLVAHEKLHVFVSKLLLKFFNLSLQRLYSKLF